MLKKFFVSFFIFGILFSGLSVFAYNETYSNSDYGSENRISEDGNPYCSENKGFLNKLRSAFIGKPTGYTPQIVPSPYLNQYYGPSYNQGFYTGNRWNDHNAYYPAYPMRVYGRSF